jgi:tRNA nucleotidyltransferase (CCA-adding enzyme)
MIKSSEFPPTPRLRRTGVVHSSENKKIEKLLKKKLPVRLFRLICKIGKAAEDYGVSAYLVGGCVRDLLLSVKNLDLDVVVEGDAIALVGLLKKELKVGVLTHPRFGTATITLPDGFKIDIASSRKEHYAYTAALPQVEFSAIKEDLFRRDFTINALAVKINRKNFGQLLDLFDGQRDLKKGKIRVLHEMSFQDDPTRIVRAIRFEQRYDFKIEPKTFKLMRKALSSRLLEKLSCFRLGREFILLLKEEKPLKAILRFDRLCGLKLIHPTIKLDRRLKLRLKSPRPGDDWLVYFALLTRRLNERELEKLCRDFSLTRKDKQRLKTLGT